MGAERRKAHLHSLPAAVVLHERISVVQRGNEGDVMFRVAGVWHPQI